MKRGYLLDTHVLLGWLDDPAGMSAEARERIADGEARVFVSAAAAWEMAIKRGLGRLDYPDDLADVLDRDAIEVLPVRLEHALAVASLPLHHRDPFDRIQIAQARIEGLVLVTRGRDIPRYDVEVLPA